MRTIDLVRLTYGPSQLIFPRTVIGLFHTDSSAPPHGCHPGPRLKGSASGTASGARIWADRARWQRVDFCAATPVPFAVTNHQLRRRAADSASAGALLGIAEQRR
jgi:hypothetical protein